MVVVVVTGHGDGAKGVKKMKNGAQSDYSHVFSSLGIVLNYPLLTRGSMVSIELLT
jgi:hypothetical protein